MKKNWKTTLLGTMAAVLFFLNQSGVKVGKVGDSDFIALGAAVAGAAAAATAKDKDVTGIGKNAKREN